MSCMMKAACEQIVLNQCDMSLTCVELEDEQSTDASGPRVGRAVNSGWLGESCPLGRRLQLIGFGF